MLAHLSQSPLRLDSSEFDKQRVVIIFNALNVYLLMFRDREGPIS